MSIGIDDLTESSDSASGVGDLLDADGDGDDDNVLLAVMSIEYTDSPNGPVIHLFGRDSDRQRHHIEISGHYPSFYIREEAYNQRTDNHYAVHETEKYDEDGDRYTDLYGNPLVRIYTTSPESISEMRELYDWTGEADVFYTTRWRIDNDIYTAVEIDTTDAVTDANWLRGEMRVDCGAVEPLSTDETPRVQPRQLTFDIEVGSDDGFPDADRAEHPVTTIVAHDSYSDTYVGWFYNDNHEVVPTADDDTGCDDLRVFEDESALLHDFNEYVRDTGPDIITGWYSNEFDIPYLVNRSQTLNVYNYQEWSPLGDTYLTRYSPVVAGRAAVDMLAAYKKTQIHNLKDKSLDAVAQREGLGGKIEVMDDDHTAMWREKPVEFLRYNKVDVQLVHEIDESRGVIEMLSNLRDLTGVSWTDPIGGNIDMMDTVVLRKAQEYGYVLPTAEEPSVGDFHGGYVITPTSGLHEHVIYPDYSSLYPNVMYQCNISPDTLIGTADDLAESDYTEDDCVWSYIDTATPPPLKSDVDANDEKMERIYFLKPSVKTGFMRSVLDDIMGMCDDYEGAMYDAAKRVRNSTYGIMGDSDSYGTGFRLFDWRLAEATTLGGQNVLKEGAEQFTTVADDHGTDATVVGGDTDSVMVSLDAADSETAVETATAITDEINEWLDAYATETFGLESRDDARMELELESYASSLFFKGDDGGTSDEGVKKRYVQAIEWDEGTWLDKAEIGIKGFEYVRSDVADVTSDVQYDCFEMLMADGTDARESIVAYVRGVITDVMKDDYPVEDIGIPFGIGQSIDAYGSTERRPQPCYRGAKYANTVLYDADAIDEGSDALYYYIHDGATGPHRKTYTSTTAEDGDYVDAVSVVDASDISDFEIDREKMVQKTIIDPLKEIFVTLGWGTQWLTEAIEDAKSPEDYRDTDQRGFEDYQMADGGSERTSGYETQAHHFM